MNKRIKFEPVNRPEWELQDYNIKDVFLTRMSPNYYFKPQGQRFPTIRIFFFHLSTSLLSPEGVSSLNSSICMKRNSEENLWENCLIPVQVLEQYLQLYKTALEQYKKEQQVL
jgi:hypothetical protein